MPEPKRPLKVFLCHAHADRDAVRALYTRLTNDGVDAWLDKEKLLPGQDWELEIKKAVREADVVVVCLSKQFNQAGFRQKEVRLALDTAMEKPEGEIFIIPARLEECDNLDNLKKWHWVDLFDKNGYQNLLKSLNIRVLNVGKETITEDKLFIEGLTTEIRNTIQQINKVAIGYLVGEKDVEAESGRTISDILLGQIPKFEHLRKGYFRDRPSIFNPLWEAFTNWITNIDNSGFVTDKIPVFWISGRSGEGKSVLLLQLISRTIKFKVLFPIIHLKSTDDLPSLFEILIKENVQRDFSESRIVILIDDMYNITDRDTWDEKVSKATSLWAFPALIITCGPTEQLEQIKNRNGDVFDVSNFNVSSLSAEECQEFIEWYEVRTGVKRNISELTTENPLLVQFIFELSQGMRISSFAKRFRKRLLNINLFETVHLIVSLNALYLDAPFTLIDTDEDRDLLERLCAEDQMHFRIYSHNEKQNFKYVRLAHPHLAWLLISEWVDYPATLSKSWARQLIKVVAHLEDTNADNTLLQGIFNQLLTTHHLVDEKLGTEDKPIFANRDEFLMEFYRLHIQKHNGVPSSYLLNKWLEFEYGFPNIRFESEPVLFAIKELEDDSITSYSKSMMASLIWLISDKRKDLDFLNLKIISSGYLIVNYDNFDSGLAIVRLLKQSNDKKLAVDFVRFWLSEYHLVPHACFILVFMITNFRNNVDFINFAKDWYIANENHPYTPSVIVVLLSVASDEQSVDYAFRWLENNLQNSAAPHVLVTLIAARPKSKKVWEILKKWIAHSGEYVNANILSAMVRHGDEEAMNFATNWLSRNEIHSQYHEVLSAIILHMDGNEMWLQIGEEYIKKPFCKHPEQIVVSLLKSGRCKPQYIELALDYAHNFVSQSQRVYILSNLARFALINIDNTILYLKGGYQIKRKRYFCRTLGWGLKRYYYKIHSLMGAAFEQVVKPEYISRILQEMLKLKVDVIDLDYYVIKWCNLYYRKKGYGFILRELRNNITIWERIVETGQLLPLVIEDFSFYDDLSDV